MFDRIEQIDQLMREAVKKVFQNMLCMEVKAEAPSPLREDAAGQIIGSVSFIGQATGIIYLHTNIAFARLVTSRMLGISEPEVDSGEMVTDAIGELSNMVVGGVKSRLCDSGWACTLTIPSVVRGERLRVEGSNGLKSRAVGFRHDKNLILAEVLLKDSAAKEL